MGFKNQIDNDFKFALFSRKEQGWKEQDWLKKKHIWYAILLLRTTFGAIFHVDLAYTNALG